MKTPELPTYTAFEGTKLLHRGTLDEVVLWVKSKMPRTGHGHDLLIFSDVTGTVIDFNFQGTEKDVLRRLQMFTSEVSSSVNTGPGRPKLGVISREVSLLPRHWEWLATQSGGASAVLRKLVEEAKIKSVSSAKQAQERCYKFMSVLAGDLPGYEEALRALYRKDKAKFTSQIAEWPRDVKEHAIYLSRPAFGERLPLGMSTKSGANSPD
ncbi:MAG: DUF2239 family protein [Bdellovibrionales bacterium]|nr:DUF2239 family protein [Bdellovibrionales bacterium]